MEELEKFIRENRKAFDTGQPPASLWKGVESALDRQADIPAREKPSAKRVSLHFVLRRVAAAAAILVIGIGIGFYMNGRNQEPDLLTLTDLSPEHAELESYYQNQVQLRTQQLVNYRQIADVQPDLEQLDEVYRELQKELEQAPKGSEVQIIQAMIDNYKAKLSILERVLERVQYTDPELSNTTGDEISI
ncbi:MAG: hypothetical protein GYB31_20390 [Bacteroidetes bacterium]|nr:hypothetical protein [Bacteroidota bacterium]